MEAFKYDCGTSTDQIRSYSDVQKRRSAFTSLVNLDERS